MVSRRDVSSHGRRTSRLNYSGPSLGGESRKILSSQIIYLYDYAICLEAPSSYVNVRIRVRMHVKKLYFFQLANPPFPCEKRRLFPACAAGISKIKPTLQAPFE